MFGARVVPMPSALVRRVVDATWRLRLQPTPAGWVDLALGVPLMDTGRARRELGWEPRTSATDALLELLDGLRDGAELPTPPLARASSGRLRLGELRTGVGAKV